LVVSGLLSNLDIQESAKLPTSAAAAAAVID
jgi:hypothetical protein